MEKILHSILAVFPTPNIEETAKYYKEVMGFKIVKYLDVKEPHICFYRDGGRSANQLMISLLPD